MNLIEVLESEWLAVRNSWRLPDNKHIDLDQAGEYWDLLKEMRGHPILHMAKLVQLSREQQLVHIVEMLTHPFMEVLRTQWTSVVIPGNDPQRDLDIFDWLFSRGKMNVDWIRLYRYADSGSFDGSEYFFRDKDTAMMFKLTWSGR